MHSFTEERRPLSLVINKFVADLAVRPIRTDAFDSGRLSALAIR